MKRWLSLISIVVALGAAALAYFLLGSDHDAAVVLPTARVSSGPFKVTLEVEGEVRAVEKVSITVPAARWRMQITFLVKEGTTVKEGEILVRFDPAEVKKEVDRLRTEKRLTEVKIAQKKAAVEATKEEDRRAVESAKLVLAKAELEVSSSDTVPELTRKANLLALEEAKLALAKAEEKMKSSMEFGGMEIEMLDLELKKTNLDLAEAERVLTKMEIYAPKPGLVVYVVRWSGGKETKPAEGETVWPGAQLIELPNLAKLEVLAYVHEVDIGSLTVGQKATIELDAYPGPTYRGEVQKIAELATKRRADSDVKEFEVVITMPEPDAKVRPGMTTKVRIPIEELKDVLSVPLDAVIEKGGKEMVYVKDASGPRSVEVRLGKRNDSHAVVLSGLTAGDEVYLGDPTAAPTVGGPGAGGEGKPSWMPGSPGAAGAGATTGGGRGGGRGGRGRRH